MKSLSYEPTFGSSTFLLLSETKCDSDSFDGSQCSTLHNSAQLFYSSVMLTPFGESSI